MALFLININLISGLHPNNYFRIMVAVSISKVDTVVNVQRDGKGSIVMNASISVAITLVSMVVSVKRIWLVKESVFALLALMD